MARRWRSRRPTALSIIAKTRTLAFTSHAPDAEGYRVFASLAGAPAKADHDDEDERRRPAEGRALRRGRLHALRLPTGVGWQSDPVGPVSFMAPPSATQACTDAPQVTLRVQKLKKKLKALKKKKWHVRFASWPTAWARARRALAQGQEARRRPTSRSARRDVT